MYCGRFYLVHVFNRNSSYRYKLPKTSIHHQLFDILIKKLRDGQLSHNPTIPTFIADHTQPLTCSI